MIEQGPIEYNHELSTLIDLVKSGASEGERVIEVLRRGDEEEIRHMLQNFGNPQDGYWGDITSASPWTAWQIDKAVEDLKTIRPPDVEIKSLTKAPEDLKMIRPPDVEKKSLTDVGTTTIKYWAW